MHTNCHIDQRAVVAIVMEDLASVLTTSCRCIEEATKRQTENHSDLLIPQYAEVQMHIRESAML